MCDNTILPHLISKNRLTELGMRLFVAEIGERIRSTLEDSPTFFLGDCLLFRC